MRHRYARGTSHASKRDNWAQLQRTLARRGLEPGGVPLIQAEIEDIVACKEEAVNIFLARTYEFLTGRRLPRGSVRRARGSDCGGLTPQHARPTAAVVAASVARDPSVASLRDEGEQRDTINRALVRHEQGQSLIRRVQPRRSVVRGATPDTAIARAASAIYPSNNANERSQNSAANMVDTNRDVAAAATTSRSHWSGDGGIHTSPLGSVNDNSMWTSVSAVQKESPSLQPLLQERSHQLRTAAFGSVTAVASVRGVLRAALGTPVTRERNSLGGEHDGQLCDNAASSAADGGMDPRIKSGSTVAAGMLPALVRLQETLDGAANRALLSSHDNALQAGIRQRCHDAIDLGRDASVAVALGVAAAQEATAAASDAMQIQAPQIVDADDAGDTTKVDSDVRVVDGPAAAAFIRAVAMISTDRVVAQLRDIIAIDPVALLATFATTVIPVIAESPASSTVFASAVDIFVRLGLAVAAGVSSQHAAFQRVALPLIIGLLQDQELKRPALLRIVFVWAASAMSANDHGDDDSVEPAAVRALQWMCGSLDEFVLMHCLAIAAEMHQPAKESSHTPVRNQTPCDRLRECGVLRHWYVCSAIPRRRFPPSYTRTGYCQRYLRVLRV